MADIFLSYAREDSAQARALADELVSLGWTVWWDPKIPIGQTFSEVIERELQAARCVVAIWSPRSVTSRWVQSEAAEGAQRDILIPVLIEETRLPLEFRRLQTASLIGWQPGAGGPEFDWLIATLTAKLGAPAGRPGAHEATPARVPPEQKRDSEAASATPQPVAASKVEKSGSAAAKRVSERTSTEARKLALVIGNSSYDDAGLSALAAPDVDIRAFAEVLKDPKVGKFDEVIELLNRDSAVVRRAIAQFFAQKKRDDLLLLYFSGHGVRDEQGHLYLAVKDTERSLLTGTGIEATFVTAQMDRSASKRQVLMLDCCHSGAFGYGSKAGQGVSVGTAAAFEGTGYGRVVLTATDATQFAWEGDQVIGEAEASLFTHYVIQGLKTGEADLDLDGVITVDELYDYVYERVVSETPKQSPGKWAYKQQGDIIIAQNSSPSVKATELPSELTEMLDSRLPSMRLEAIGELKRLLQGRHPGRALAAREALQRVAADDDSRLVSRAAEKALAENPLDAVAEPVIPPAPMAEAKREQREQEEHERRARQVVQQARLEFAEGQHEAAISKLQEFRPSHVLVTRTLTELENEHDRLRREAEEAERRERERREREHKILETIQQASRATSHDEALALLHGALQLHPEDATVRLRIEERTAALEREQAEQQRLQALAATRTQIERHLARSRLDEAEKALADAETDAQARQTLEPLRSRLKELRTQQQHDRRAQEVVTEAKRQFSAGEHHGALSTLQRFEPAHDLVSRTAEELTAQAAEIQRLRREEEERRAEIERQAKARQAEAQRQAEAERLRQEIQWKLIEARRLLAGQDFDGAMTLVEAVLQIDAKHRQAIDLRADLQRALEEKGRKEALEQQQARARQELVLAATEIASGPATHETAIAALRRALELDPANERVRQLLQEREATLAAEAAEERRQQELAAAILRIEALLATKRLDQAEDALVAAERNFQAIAELQSIRQALEKLRREAEQLQIEEKRRKEAERRERAAGHVAAARTAIDRQRFAEALEELDHARDLHAGTAGLGELVERARAGKAAAEEAERVGREVADKLAHASKRLARRDFSTALELAEEALKLDPASAAAGAILADAQHATAEQRRAEELEQQERERRSAEQQQAALDRDAAKEKRRQELADVAQSVEALLAERQFAAAAKLLAQNRTGFAPASPLLGLQLKLWALRAGTHATAAARAATTGVAVLRKRPIQLGLAGVLVAGGALYVALQPRAPSPARPVEQVVDSNTPAGSIQPPGERPIPSVPPPAVVIPEQPKVVIPEQPKIVEGTVPSAVKPLRDKRILDIEGRARQELARRDRHALETLSSGLKLDAGDAELRQVLLDVWNWAQADALSARTLATRVGAPATSSEAYKNAEQKLAEGIRLRQAEEGVRALWAARDSYAKAASDGEQIARTQADDEKRLADEARRRKQLADDEARTKLAAAEEARKKQLADDARKKQLADDEARRKAVADEEARAKQLANQTSTVEGVQQALREYESAYESLSVAAVLRVQPSFTPEEANRLTSAFSSYRSYNLTLQDLQISLSGTKATASCRAIIEITPKVGNRQTRTVARVFQLERRANGWVIVSVQ